MSGGHQCLYHMSHRKPLCILQNLGVWLIRRNPLRKSVSDSLRAKKSQEDGSEPEFFLIPE